MTLECPLLRIRGDLAHLGEDFEGNLAELAKAKAM